MIEIHHYNPVWPAWFEAEAARLRAALPQLVAIEHIGSTAVPGLAAKPIIDLMAALPRLDEAAACLAPLEALGYVYEPGHEVYFPDQRFLRRCDAEQRWHHLHLVAIDSDNWDRHLLFRDYLRRSPRTAAHYETLKQVLRDRSLDAHTYTAGKVPFIQSIEALARAERDGGPLPGLR